MGKTSKIYINLGGSYEQRVEALANAEDIDLKVLSAIALLADSEGKAQLTGLEELIGADKAEVNASVKFWKGAGVLSATKPSVSADVASAVEHAHKDGAIAQVVGVEEYSNDELAAVLETRVGSGFVDEAQKAMGKIFNKNEVAKLVGFVDQLGFEEEAVLAILSYCVRLEKKSLAYAEKIALSFHDEDVTTAVAVHAEIDYLERINSAVGKIQLLFGFGSRKLSTNERKYFTAWTEEWGFDLDVITRAYEITVDNTQAPVPKYTNSILKKWYENGLKTLADVERFIAEESQQRRATPSPASRTARPAARAEKNEKETEADEWLRQKLLKTFGDS